MALVGIARMAWQSELLEAKREVQYFELPARSILNRTNPNMPFQWTINPYRGCEFGCKYCYARYTHEFMEMAPADFEDKIYAKSAAAHLLRQELGKLVGRRDLIAIGTATDPYQPAERRFGRTRAILEVFARERGRRLGLTTKSDLVVRDLDLLREIARANVLSINLTVTTLNGSLARLMEPRAHGRTCAWLPSTPWRSRDRGRCLPEPHPADDHRLRISCPGWPRAARAQFSAAVRYS